MRGYIQNFMIIGTSLKIFKNSQVEGGGVGPHPEYDKWPMCECTPILPKDKSLFLAL